jgi:hypothetical protein
MANGEIYIHESFKNLIAEISDYPGGFTVDLLDCLAMLFAAYFRRGVKGEPVETITSKQAYAQAATNRCGY